MKGLLKKTYEGLPFKAFVFRMLRIFPIPERLFRHLHFKGLIKIKSRGTFFLMYHYGFQLENEIFWKGIEHGWESTSLRVWTELSKKAKCIIDIGANTGLFSLLSKSIQPQAKVIAFEPVMRVFEKLTRNIEINDFSITAERIGLSDYIGTAVIYDLPTEHIYSVTINENLDPSNSAAIPTTIAVTTLDDYQRQHHVPKVDLIKIDVETHEPAVLNGMLDMIKRDLPTMIIEVLNDSVAEKINSVLSQFDYRFFLLDDDKGPMPVSVITTNKFKNYLVCSEAEERYLRNLSVIAF